LKPLYLEPDEVLQLHALVASTLAPRSVREDPDTLPLRTALTKIRALADSVYCRRCKEARGTYANGMCRRCYRKQMQLKSA
jgi:ribosomal protein L40E